MSDFPRCAACPALEFPSCPAEHHARYCALAAKGGSYWPAAIRAKAAEAATAPVALAEPLDPLTFVTEAMLLEDTLRLMAALPPDVDAIVGVARSGLLVATPIAVRLNLPLWTATRAKGVLDPGAGFRTEGAGPAEPPRHVALIDDTIATGREMRELPPVVRATFPDARLTRAVVYASPQTAGLVDLYVRALPGPHYLSWNWQNAGHGERCGYDFDGILCADRPYGSPGDPPPLYLPRRLPIPLIVTGRGECDRAGSEAWLARYGIRCERLVMRPDSVPIDHEAIARHKAKHYAESDLPLFAESDPAQAAIIAEVSGKPVLCPAAGRVFPGSAAEPAAPSLARRAFNYAKAQARHTLNGRKLAAPELLAARIAACDGCDSLRPSDRVCSERTCGCKVEAKARWESERCPLGKWPAQLA